MKTITKPDADMERLNKMLKTRTFDQLLTAGEIFDIEGAREKLGYSAWGLRRLCRNGKIAHILRGDQYFFLASQVSSAFKVIQAKP
jgi:hypothetical protein